MNVPLQQREVRLLRQHDFVTRGERERVVVAAQVVERVSEIYRPIEVLRTLRQNLVPELRRLAILAFKEQRPLPFTLNARIVHHCWSRAVYPRLGKLELVILNRGVGSASDQRGVLGSEFVSLFI